MPSVTEVFGVMLAVMVVFAILGLQLFMGSFGSCADDSYTTKESCIAAASAAYAGGPNPPTYWRRALKGSHANADTGNTDFATSDSTTAPWLNPSFGSFDNFGSAMLLLYVMSTGDGWEDVMYQGMDAVGLGVAPERNDFSPTAFFFIAWMFFGAFFALNLFVGTAACTKCLLPGSGRARLLRLLGARLPSPGGSALQAGMSGHWAPSRFLGCSS